MSKKQMMFVVVLNIFLIFLGGIIIRWITNNRLKSFWTSVESSMGTKVNDIKKSNFLALQSYLVDTVTTAKKSVVSITISKDVKFYVEDPSQLNWPWSIQQQTTKVGWWSGILVTKNGYIITNKHVVQDTTAKYSVIVSDGRTYNVDKIWFDDLLDIALLKIVNSEGISPTDLTATTFLPLKTQIDIGQFVLTIGNALSKYPHTVTMGILWGKNKQLTINGNNFYIGLYQTDAHAGPGNSWGPLLDIDGNTIGMTTAIDEWEGMTFALPLSQEFMAWTIKSIETFGKISRPIIGIQYVEISSSLKAEKKLTSDTGIFVNDVLTDLPAWEAWLKVGDVIVAINDNEITRQMPFLYQLYTYIPGDTITLSIIRDGKTMGLTVVLGGNTQ